MRACDAAIAILIETNNPSVMYGDETLCHLIAERLGWEHEGPATSRRLLRALSKTPGPLVKSFCRMPSDCCARGQRVLHFELPPAEHCYLMDHLSRGVAPDWDIFRRGGQSRAVKAGDDD